MMTMDAANLAVGKMPQGRNSCHCATEHEIANCKSPCTLKDSSFKKRAKEILLNASKVTAGCVHLIGLNDIREELGDRWERVKARVHDYTERLLDKVLSPRDLWFHHGEEGYIIVFADRDKLTAQLVCGKIVEDLHQALLGHADTRRITVRTAVMELDGHVAVNKASMDELLQLAADAAAAPQPAPAMAEVVAEAVAEVAEDAAESAVAALAALAPSRPPPPRVLFRPVFDVRNKVISTHTCRLDADTQRYLHLANTDDPEHEEALFTADIKVLTLAVATLNELYANKFRYAQTIPVHFSSIASMRRRRAYLQVCRMIAPHLVPFLAFELDDLPQGIPYGRLADLVASLKPFARAVLVMTRDDGPDLPAFAQAGVKGVGIQLDARDGEARAIERIQAFCPQPRKFGLFSFVDGLRTPAQFQAAEERGAAYLLGPMIGEDSDVPEHMRRCSERQLLRRAHARGAHRDR